MIGESISHYRVIRKLGAGGMGEVYLAEDTTLGRHVALKILPPEHTQNRERVHRFKLEARSASALNHPGILTIHEFGEADGRHFIATEFIDGESLRTVLTGAGRMDVREALHTATQIAGALAAAHEAGIIHRDIKPENIMRRRDGFVKVLDFGLAKLTEPETRGDADGVTPTITAALPTEPGVMLGTAAYMAPEQVAGRPVDPRSDIFSFGAVLYEMVTGGRAFQGASRMETLAAILNQDPTPVASDLDPDLVHIILRCLRKDPARRFQTMADVKAALLDVGERSRTTPAARSGGPLPLPRASIVAASASVALLAALTVWQPWRTPEPAEPLSARPLTTLPGIEQYPSLAPDGDHLVFVWSGEKQDNQDLYVQRIGSGSPLRLTTDADNDYNPVWSPDGRWIAFLRSQPMAPTGIRRRELRVIPPLGGTERKVADIRSQDFLGGPMVNTVYLAWSSDSRALIVTDSPGEGQPDALFVVSLETGEKRQLTYARRPILADTSPAVSPDGRSLVFLRRATSAEGELQVLPLGDDLTASGEPRSLTTADLHADYPAWTPDGREVVFAARGGLWRVAVSGRRAPARLPYIGEDGMMPSLSRPQQPGQSVRMVYLRSLRDTNFWRLNTTAPGAPASSAPVVAIASSQPEYHPAFSPDGRRVAFTSYRSGAAEIWVSDPDGSNALQLTTLGALDTNCPRWSPDAQLVVFSSMAEGEFDVYVVPAAGGRPRRLTTHPGIDLCPSFSRDGRWIYFGSNRSGDYRVWKMPAQGGEAVQVSADHGNRPIEGRDGSLFYNSAATPASVWRVPAPGADPIRLLDGIEWFNFQPVDGGAYYIERADGAARLRYLNFAKGTSTTVAGNLGDVSAYLGATGDGRTILFTRVDTSIDDLMVVEGFR
jgi:serine/threonine protein kinase